MRLGFHQSRGCNRRHTLVDGCSDSDNDGFDTDLEIDCNTDPNNALSFPTDLDNDGTCDYLDTDTDGDGYLDVDELAAGTDPFDPLSKPANRLPECAKSWNSSS